jgi:hypothetical protein
MNIIDLLNNAYMQKLSSSQNDQNRQYTKNDRKHYKYESKVSKTKEICATTRYARRKVKENNNNNE